MLEDGFREGDYVYERSRGTFIKPLNAELKGKDKHDFVFGGIWRYRPEQEEQPRSPMDEIVMQAFRDAEDEKTTYRAIRVLVIEGTEGFVRETLKRSVIDAEIATAFIEQGGTVSYRSTKFEKVLEIEEAELGE